MNIREMKPEDYDSVVEIWQTAELQFCPVGRESREAILRQIAAFPTLSLVAEKPDGGGLAGVVLGTHDTRKGWINRLAVHPAHQRKGIAAALVSCLFGEYEILGIEVVAALVKDGNDASLALCNALGLEPMDNIRYLSRRKSPDC